MLENGNEGAYFIGWIVAVKKGLVEEGSGRKTSTFIIDGEGPVGVKAKRARCLTQNTVSQSL